VIATGFGAQRRRRPRTAGDEASALGDRPPRFDPGDSLDVPSFLRED
jgi:hypothetical protein